MQVLHVIPSVSLVHGGPSTAIRTLTQALVRGGVHVHVATTDDDGVGHLAVPLAQPVQEQDVTYWYFPRQTRFYKFSLPLTHWLARHIREYDVVHLHALFQYPCSVAAFLAAGARVPYIVRPLGVLNRWGMQNYHPWLKRVSFSLIEKKILAGAALMHYTSAQERREAAELGIARPYVIIPIGVDLEELSNNVQTFERLNVETLVGRLIILFLSRLDPKKGLDLLLPAFAKLKAEYPNVGLVLAGDGQAEYVATLRRQAQELGIERDVYWAGFLSGADKRAALQAADVFVLPSYSENFGIAVVEAMALGLPVVISDQVGIHPQVAEAGAGIVVPCEKNAVLAALRQLVNNPGLRQAMGRRAQQLANDEFSTQAVTARLIQAYVQVVNRQHNSI